MKNTILSCLVAALLPITALAEEPAPASEPAAEPAAAPADGPTTPPPAAPSADESIYVVQKRAYSKSGRLELSALPYLSVNNKFVGYAGLGLSAAYHVRENFAVAVTTSIPKVMLPFYSGLVYEVRAIDLTPEVVDLKQMRYFGSIDLQYSALYGKLDFYDWLIDYDFYATAGTGIVTTVEVCVPPNENGGDPDCSDEVPDIGYGQKTPEDGADARKIAGNLGGGMRVFFSDAFGLRLEVRDIVYADRAADQGQVVTDIRNTILVFLGLSLLI